MYELDNETFSYEELLKAAENKGYTIDELFEKNPNLKKVEDTTGKPTSQGPGAPVAETAAPEIQLTDTVSQSVDGSLELQEPVKTDIAKDTTIEIAPRLTKDQEEKILSDFEKASKINEDLEAKKLNEDKKKRFDKGSFKLSEKIEYNKYKETGELDYTLLTPEEINQKVANKRRDYMEGLSFNERTQLLSSQSTVRDSISKNVEQLESKMLDNVATINTIINDYNASAAQGTPYPESRRLENVELVKELKNSIEEMDSQRLADLAVLDKKDDFINSFKRSYSNLDQLENVLKTTAADISLGVMVPLDMAKTAEGKEKSVTNDLLKYREALQKESGETLPKPIPVESISGFKDLVNWGSDALVNFVPSGAMALSGAAAPYLFGVSGFGSRIARFELDALEAKKELPKLQELYNNSTDETEKQKIKEQLDLYNKTLNTTDLEKLIVSGIYGAAEVGTEMLTTVKLVKDLKSANTLFYKEGFKPAFQKAILDIPLGGALEGGGEGLNSIIGNFADITILDEDKSLLEGATESAAQGFFIGNGFKIVSAGNLARAYALDVISDKEKKNKIKKTLAEINALSEAFEQDVDVNSKLQAANVIRNKIKEVGLEQDYTASAFLKLTEAEQKQVFEADRKAKKVNERWTKIAGSNLNETSKGLIRDDLEAEFNSYQDEKISLLRKPDAILPLLVQPKGLEAGDFVRGFKIHEVNNSSVRRNNSLNKFANKVADVLESEVEPIQQFIESNETTFELNDKTVITKPEAKEIIEIWNAGANGGFSPATKNQYAFVERAAANNPATALHEYAHAMFNAKGFTKEQFDAINNDYKDLLKEKKDSKEITEKQYNDIVSGIKQYDSSAAQSEEIINLSIDAINLNILKQNDVGFLQKLANNFKSAIGTIIGKQEAENYNINTAEDAWNMVNTFSKDVLTKAPVEIVGTDKPEEAKEDVKFSLAEDASKKVQQIYDEQGVAGAMDIVDEYKGMAAKIAAVYRDRPGFETYKEDLIDGILNDPTYGVLGLTLKYKPEENKGVPLAAYINKYLRPRSITLANQLLGKDEASTFKSDITEVKDVMATETAEDAITASEEIAKEKPKKKKDLLSDRISFDNETQQKFITSINKAIALNIKKFDETTTKNRTITPFVADVKKDLADFAEKDIVKFIKSYGLEKFLIDNRDVILDNFTTTFLSKHPFFRKGILKRVNGEWVAPAKVGPYKYDWIDEKGNKLKIDRDNAAGRGMTSGPEFIKRNPKIKEILKENEFVEYHFQDGALRNKAKQNPVFSIARQIASEKGFEVLKQDIENEGELTLAIQERADLIGIINLDNKIKELKTDLDRGIVKFSIPALNKLPEHAKYIFEDNMSLFAQGVALNDLNVDYAFNAVFENENLGISDSTKKELIKDLQNYVNKIWIGEKNITGQTIEQKINSDIYEKDSEWKGLSRIIETIPFNISIKNKEAVEQTIKDFNKIFSSINELDPLQKALWISEFMARPFSHGVKSSMINGNANILKEVIIPVIGEKEYSKIKNKFKINKNGQFVLINPITKKGIAVKPGEAYYYSTNSVYKKLISSKGENWSDVFKQKEQMDSNAESSQNAFLFLIEKLKSAYEKGNIKKESLAMLINSLYSDQRALMRKMYKFEGIFISKNHNKEKEFVYEHNPPISSMGRLALSYIIGDSNFKVLNNALNEAKAYITPKSMDDIIIKNGHQMTYNPKKGILDRVNIKGYELVKNPETSVKYSKSMNTTFNNMLERKKGILNTENISKATAKLQGQSKGKFKVFVPPSADDLLGLIYNFLGTGKQGDADMKFFNEKLFRPLAKANFQLNAERQAIKQRWQEVVKSNKGITKILRKESDYKFYTNDHAVRAWMWDKLGYDIPGISETDKAALIESVNSSEKLLKFGEELIDVPNKKESWLKPEDDWTASTVEMDLQEILSKIGRARIFEEFITNADVIFSEDNLNKIEAAYGPKLRGALEDMLYRIEKGRARNEGGNKMAAAYLDWVRGSVATTMFFNTRSALLQQLSIVNFTNWEDNNIFAQGKFIAGSPKTYAKYWVDIFNSDWMKERRQGLKTDINESELVAKLEGSKNKNKALLAYVLEKGFSLTKYGDNIAIATGGAPFLYNREQKYIKEGMTEAEAKKEAFLDFQELAESTQQSSRQDLLSNQQVSVIGRIFLAFQNTTMQMTRLQKKAALDIINKRGSFKANISRLVYYGAIQNTIFAFLQNALFAGVFGDDEDENLKLDDKALRAANTVLDSALRGSGIGGAAVATLKNAIIAWAKENDKGWKADNSKVIIELLNISPALGIKARKINTAMNAYKYGKNVVDDVSFANPNHPYYGIAGSLTSAAFNIPLDRVVTKAQNLQALTNQEAEAWQRTALFLGYNTWDVGLKDPEIEAAKGKKKGFKSEFKNEFKSEFKNEFK